MLTSFVVLTYVWFRQQCMGSVWQLPQREDRSWRRTCAPRNLKHWRPALSAQSVTNSVTLLLFSFSPVRWSQFKCYHFLLQAKKKARWMETTLLLLERQIRWTVFTSTVQCCGRRQDVLTELWCWMAAMLMTWHFVYLELQMNCLFYNTGEMETTCCGDSL